MMLPQAVELGDPSSKEANPVEEALVRGRNQAPCYPAGTKQDAWVPCSSVCLFNLNIFVVTPPSDVFSTGKKPGIRTYKQNTTIR